MAKAKFRDLPDLSDHARPGAEFDLRATPKAGRDRLVIDETGWRIYVTAVAEGGKANAAVRAVLAAALGVAPTRLTLVAGETSRNKRFRLD